MLSKDPLIHFLVIGAVLFAVLTWRADDEAPERIVITEDRVQQFARSVALLEGRQPSAEEIRQMVEPVIREEVYYREALALGLDVNDDEVRRRLVEKMQYLTEDLADPEPASNDVLRAFYDSDPARFEVPELVTFDQVFFSPSQRGDALDADVASALEALDGGAEPADHGDRTPLEDRFMVSPRERITILFGEPLTDAVFTADPDQWLGPFESDFGLHLVRVIERSEARQPAFDEIEDQVRQVYAEESRRAANEAAYAEMRSRYEIIVDWPEAAGEASAP